MDQGLFDCSCGRRSSVAGAFAGAAATEDGAAGAEAAGAEKRGRPRHKKKCFFIRQFFCLFLLHVAVISGPKIAFGRIKTLRFRQPPCGNSPTPPAPSSDVHCLGGAGTSRLEALPTPERYRPHFHDWLISKQSKRCQILPGLLK